MNSLLNAQKIPFTKAENVNFSDNTTPNALRVMKLGFFKY